MMNNNTTTITREEENCLKAALAMMVVKNRLLQKHHPSSSRGHESSSSSCLPTNKRQESPDSSTTTTTSNTFKKLRTMETLVFASTASPDAEDYQENNSNNNNDDANAAGDGQTIQSQKDHILTMTVTAVRKALKLMDSTTTNSSSRSYPTAKGGPDTTPKMKNTTKASNQDSDHAAKTKKKNNPNEIMSFLLDDWTQVLAMAGDKHHPSHSIWVSLDALTCHISKQLTLSLELAYQNPGHNNNNNTNEGFWIETWMEESLQELLAFSSTDSSSNSSSSSSTDDEAMARANNNNNNNNITPNKEEILSASFLVWYGILFGGYGISMVNNNIGTAAPPTDNDARSSPGARLCRHLFVETFCQLLRDQNILSLSVVDDPSTEAPLNDHHHAWKRMFQSYRRQGHNKNEKYSSNIASVISVSSTSTIINNNNNNTLGQQHCFDLWMVHGLRLVQTLMDDYKEENEERRKRSKDINNDYCDDDDDLGQQQLQDAFLPPGNLVQFYVQEQAADWGEGSGASNHLDSAAPKLDVGAKLMAMVALYDSLEKADVI